MLAQRTQLAQTLADLPPLEKALAQTRHQLAVYAGRLPSEAGLPEFELASLALPQALPLSLPSTLVRQRPDVRASEALLHQASAQVGVATANLYPQIQLTASYGSAATARRRPVRQRHRAVEPAGRTDAAALPRRRADARSGARRSPPTTRPRRSTSRRVLTAFQNVADALRALEFDAAALQAQATAEALAKQSLDLSTQQYRARRDQLRRAADRAAGLAADPHRAGAGAGRALRRHRGAVPGAGRRLVEPRRGPTRRSAAAAFRSAAERRGRDRTRPKLEKDHDQAHVHHDRLRAVADRRARARQIPAGQEADRVDPEARAADRDARCRCATRNGSRSSPRSAR